jgi:hypothetical protein
LGAADLNVLKATNARCGLFACLSIPISLKMLVKLLSPALLLSAVVAQELTTALGAFPEVSAFGQLLQMRPEIQTNLLSTVKNATLLIPNNDAIAKFAVSGGQITSLTDDQLLTLMQYHVVVRPLTGAELTVNGLTIPTFLQSQQYNNRSAGAELTNRYGNDAKGQVLFFSSQPLASGSSKRTVMVKRQATAGTGSNVRGGLDLTSKVQTVDGKWNGGIFQIVDR